MDSSQTLTPGFSPVLLGVGLLLALLGWVLYWGGVLATGSLLGAGIGGSLGWVVAHWSGWTDTAAWISVGVGIVAGGAAGAWGARFMHNVAFFIGGAVIGSVLIHSLLLHLRGAEVAWASQALYEIPLRSAGVLFGGMILVLLNRYLIILISSTLGTLLIVSSWPVPPLLLATPMIWLLSVLIQFHVAKKFNFPRPEKPRE